MSPFRLFFLFTTKRNSHFIGELVVSYFRRKSLCWNCAFAHFQNKFEKCRLFACFFFSRPSATRISLASWSCLTFEESLCVGTALIIHFENKFQNFICCLFFLLCDQTQLSLSRAPEKCPHFLGKGRMVRLLTTGKS